jgi:hypothetical protein
MNADLMEGIIVLTEKQRREKNVVPLWPKGVIPYTINTYHYSE